MDHLLSKLMDRSGPSKSGWKAFAVVHQIASTIGITTFHFNTTLRSGDIVPCSLSEETTETLKEN